MSQKAEAGEWSSRDGLSVNSSLTTPGWHLLSAVITGGTPGRRTGSWDGKNHDSPEKEGPLGGQPWRKDRRLHIEGMVVVKCGKEKWKGNAKLLAYSESWLFKVYKLFTFSICEIAGLKYASRCGCCLMAYHCTVYQKTETQFLLKCRLCFAVY